MNISNKVADRKKTPQLVEKWEQKGNRFYLSCPQTVLEVSVYADNIIRFRFSPEGFFEKDFSYAVVNEQYEPDCDYQMDVVNDEYHLSTDKLICKITKTLHVTITDLAGNIVLEDEQGFHWERSQAYGGNFVYCSKRIQEQEYFYGLGDKAGPFNLRGKRYENWGTDRYGFENGTDALYKNIPFYFGCHHGIGYGIFFDNSFRSHFDFGYERGDVASYWADGGEMNYYFIYGPELLTVAESYTHLTGTHELPPMWALGYHQSKWSYNPESNVKEITEGLRSREIPCDVIHIDIDYMDGFRCFTWDKTAFPDPKRMISELENDGFKTVVIIDPGIKIDPEYSVYQEGIQNGYFCRRADGPLMEGEVWPGVCHFPDFTNPTVREWWAGLYEEFMESGISGVWNDMNEPAIFESVVPDDTRHNYDGQFCSHRKAHNVYGMQMARATFQGVKKSVFPKRPLVITRSGYAGLQRFSAVWTGDNIATWEHLWIANLQCQRMSISGVSFVGSDIGGFIGQPNAELYIRWLQMGVFHPFFRTHSSGDHGDQEPWSFGEEYVPLIRDIIGMRYTFMPYLYTAFWQHSDQGTPFLKPLSFVDQNDPETLFRMEEFVVGHEILVCPISKEGGLGRDVYLPKGQWYDYHTDKLYEGKQQVFIPAPIKNIPVLVRAGTILPHYPVMQYIGENQIEQLTMHLYYREGTTSSQLYEDAGDFYDHEQGNYCVKVFTQTGSKTEITIQQFFEGRFNTTYNKIRFVLHGLPFTPSRVFMDDLVKSKELEIEKINGNYSFLVGKKFETITITRMGSMV